MPAPGAHRAGCCQVPCVTELHAINTSADNGTNSNLNITANNARAGFAEASIRGQHASIDVMKSGPAAPTSGGEPMAAPRNAPRALGNQKSAH